MSTERPVAKPRWWKITLIPTWIGHTLEFFAVLMLLVYPLAAATAHAEVRWTIFATVIIFSLLYGLYASHRIRRTVIASDEISYTVRLEWVRRRSSSSRRSRLSRLEGRNVSD